MNALVPRRFATRAAARAMGIFLAVVVGLSMAGVSRAESPSPTHPLQVEPTRFVLVLDKSGSTEGERHHRILESSNALVASLSPGSQIAVVAFDSQATVISDLVSLTDAGRQQLVSRIAEVVPRGGTDMLAGVEKGLELLAGQPGVILLVSDGYQTGQGADPLPESVWGDPARALARKSRQSHATIHTIGLGPDVEADPLLLLMARETGGAFHGVREASDLMKQFVSLASLWGSFWTRSAPAQFTVHSPEVVVQLVPSRSGHQLYRQSGPSWIPVDPICSFRHEAARAERFFLEPGVYSFRPERDNSHLLRPLGYYLQPQSTQLKAARSNQLELAIVTREGVALPPDLTDLEGLAHYRQLETNETLRMHASREGRNLQIPLRPESSTGQYHVVVDLQQQGWHYRSPRISGHVVNPTPIEVSLTTGEKLPLQRTSREPVRTIHVELTAEFERFDHELILRARSSRPDIQLVPDRISLDKSPQQLTLALSGPASVAGDLSTMLEFDLVTSDIVPSLIHGASIHRVDVEWKHLVPQLFLENLDLSQPRTIHRGTQQQIPFSLRGKDLAGEDGNVGLMLAAVQVPSGISLQWEDLGRGSVLDDLDVLPFQAARPALQIHVDRNLAPGEYELEFAVQATDSSIPLNGRHEPLPYRVEVIVPRIAAQLRVAEGNTSWNVRAPLTGQVSEFEFELTASDKGGIPPDVRFEASATPPLRVDELPMDSASGSSPRVRYRMTIPAQSKPCEGSLTVRAHGSGLASDLVSRIPVIVEEVEIGVDVGEVEMPRYHGVWEWWLGWTRPAHREPLRIEFTGASDETRPTFRLYRIDSESGRTEIPADEEGNYEFVQRGEFEVVLAPPYQHTMFPQDPRGTWRHPVPIREVLIPLPVTFHAGMILASVGLVGLIGLGLRRSLIRIQVVPGDSVRRGLFRIRLHHVLGRRGLKLVLTRDRVYRSRRDQSDHAVIIDMASRQTCELPPGHSVSVRRGDTIQVLSPGQSECLVEILSGSPQPTLDSAQSDSAEDHYEEEFSVPGT